jgi:hypothetical protein
MLHLKDHFDLIRTSLSWIATYACRLGSLSLLRKVSNRVVIVGKG